MRKRDNSMRFLFRGGIILAVLIVGVSGFALWAHQPAIAPISPPAAANFSKAEIQRGPFLAAAGDCAECHTVPGGAPYAGGYPLPTPFGTIYGSNLTPDASTGIGSWSETAFARALRHGVRQDGALCRAECSKTSGFQVSAQSQDCGGRLEPALFQTRPLPARSAAKRCMESRCLSRRRARPLRCLPYATQCPRRGDGVCLCRGD